MEYRRKLPHLILLRDNNRHEGVILAVHPDSDLGDYLSTSPFQYSEFFDFFTCLFGCEKGEWTAVGAQGERGRCGASCMLRAFTGVVVAFGFAKGAINAAFAGAKGDDVQKVLSLGERLGMMVIDGDVVRDRYCAANRGAHRVCLAERFVGDVGHR